MATTAQALANRANAQHSTGPKTEAGKAAVSQNATSHGLSSARFFFLPHENPEEFAALLTGLEDEYQPETVSERFLITEMARAQWKLVRIEAIEGAILAGAASGDSDPWVTIAQEMQNQAGDALLKLDRYAASARRTWHKSLDTLLKLRDSREVSDVRYSRVRRNLSDMALNEMLTAPMPGEPVYFAQVPQITGSKLIPGRFNVEIAVQKSLDPNFDVNKDSHKMSPAFRRWLNAA